MPLSLSFVAFLAVLVPLYFLVSGRLQWTVLLVGSVVFYAFSGWHNLLVMTALCAVTYVFGRLLGRSVERQNQVLTARRADGTWDKATRKAFRDACVFRRKWLLAAGITLVLSLLAFFKYDAFLIRTFNGIAGTSYSALDVAVPLGISYVTLSAISYMVDVFRGQLPMEKHPARLALFLFYFPQMWQGPINRYGELAPALFAPHAFDAQRCLKGGLRALWGGVKKVVIANTVGVAVWTITQSPSEFGGSGTWLLILLYTIQIYADFTGGMDIALGVSHALGIDLYENFDRPFGASSVADYWRRWHRSMGRFFTDYVFYPLSTCRVSGMLAKLSRRLPLWLATLATWTLTGLWHGAGWNFVLWGLFNGLFILFSQELRPLRRRIKGKCARAANSRVWSAVCCGGTLFLVGLFRTLDLQPDARTTLALWGKALTPSAVSRLFDASLWSSLGLSLPEWILVALGVIAMWLAGRATGRVGEASPSLGDGFLRKPWLFALICALMVTGIAVFGHYGLGYHVMDFIYGRF